jgi:predicted acylesterase/phospholipase RssA
MSNDGAPLKLQGKRVVLLLQGGGALGAYQVGAYRELQAACRRVSTKLDWVGGISIGAVNAAVIAGPNGGDAAAELAALWAEILSPPCPPFDSSDLWQNLPPAFRAGRLAPLVPKYANWMWAAFNPFGQRHFFGSRVLDPLRNPWFAQWSGPLTTGELAFFDTEPLRDTLNRHVNWQSINTDGNTRLSLGATRVRDGESVFFHSFAPRNPDWTRTTLSADHVLASAALPPGFPGITIAGEVYWDGGVSTNTPIENLAEDLTAESAPDTLVFLIDLWDRKGALPQSFDDLVWRQKSIAYGSRKRAAVTVVNTHQLEVEAKRVPPTRLEVCQVMLEQPPGDAHPQFSFADADFSRTRYEELVALGSKDMLGALEHPHPVPGVGGEYAVLYRHGTYEKHRATDGKYAAIRERQQQLERTWARNGNVTHS